MRDDRGSVLALMPAAVLVFVVLGALAVDSALAFMGERQVSNLAAAVANDAAVQAIDFDRYYRTGEIVLDPVRVEDVAIAALGTSGLAHLEELAIDTDVIGGDVVRVEVRARVRSLFSRALPDGIESRAVGASAEAVAERG